ncbi:hypothetical protein [Halarcobacter sp.]|uniref:hypothetical protein n=1 Tax=Halarcobacter sp. TaxID=2321133 RepID=UPI002AAB04BD|nr:hypothetical protein [Halarcobacter sp.]
MPKKGDSVTTTLKDAHLKWGSHRYTNSRKTIYGEGYLQVPRKEAKNLNLHNSNKVNANNIYKVSTSDGYLKDVDFKAQGCMRKGDIYAKQLSASGDLKVLGDWYSHIGATKGDQIEIKWTSPTDILLTKI